MCGIVGYVGPREATPILSEGPAALEYRGYDSAGGALVSGGKLTVCKDKGKVDHLRELLGGVADGATLGISHTRWATHGAPSQANAHPHTDAAGRIALVHNGIIENYRAIKERLRKEGVTFRSETDTEALAQLVGWYYARSGKLADAVRRALAEVEGTFGVAVVARDCPGLLIGARRGSPLVVGIGEGEYVLASDACAIVRHTKRVIYLKDNNLVELTPAGHRTTTLDNRAVAHEVQQLEYDAEALAKGGFRHFMLKEIFEQP